MIELNIFKVNKIFYLIDDSIVKWKLYYFNILRKRIF